MVSSPPHGVHMELKEQRSRRLIHQAYLFPCEAAADHTEASDTSGFLMYHCPIMLTGLMYHDTSDTSLLLYHDTSLIHQV